MKLEIGRKSVSIVFETDHDMAYLQDTLGIADQVGSYALFRMSFVEPNITRVRRLEFKAENNRVMSKTLFEQLDDIQDRLNTPDQSGDLRRQRMDELKVTDLDLSQIPKASMVRAWFTADRGEMNASNIVSALRRIGVHVNRQTVATMMSNCPELYKRVERGIYRRIGKENVETLKRPENVGEPVARIIGRVDLPGESKSSNGDVDLTTLPAAVIDCFNRNVDDVISTNTIRNHLNDCDFNLSIAAVEAALMRLDFVEKVNDGLWRRCDDEPTAA